MHVEDGMDDDRMIEWMLIHLLYYNIYKII